MKVGSKRLELLSEKGIKMLLIVFAALGFGIGYRLGLTRPGFVTLAAVSIGASVLQVVHLVATTDRTSMTMLPLVVGAVVVASMLVGVLTRKTSRPSSAA